MKKTNTFETLFNELLKIIQLLEKKEMSNFQKELFKNILHSAQRTIALTENPFLIPSRKRKTDEKNSDPDPDPEATKKYNEEVKNKPEICNVCPNSYSV